MSDDQNKIIKILRLGKINDCNWFDFEQVPQGYIKRCGTAVPRPKGMRAKNNLNVTADGDVLIDPTDIQIMEYAKTLMKHSKQSPDEYTFAITSEDFRSKK